MCVSKKSSSIELDIDGHRPYGEGRESVKMFKMTTASENRLCHPRFLPTPNFEVASIGTFCYLGNCRYPLMFNL